jgi:hypothetical protein
MGGIRSSVRKEIRGSYAKGLTAGSSLVSRLLSLLYCITHAERERERQRWRGSRYAQHPARQAQHSSCRVGTEMLPRTLNDCTYNQSIHGLEPNSPSVPQSRILISLGKIAHRIQLHAVTVDSYCRVWPTIPPRSDGEIGGGMVECNLDYPPRTTSPYWMMMMIIDLPAGCTYYIQYILPS